MKASIQNILLIEPQSSLRESVKLVLTTTGGFQVTALTCIPNDKPDTDVVLLPAILLPQFLSSILADLPFILTTKGNTPAKGNYLGEVLIQELPLPAVAEKVRQLL